MPAAPPGGQNIDRCITWNTSTELHGKHLKNYMENIERITWKTSKELHGKLHKTSKELHKFLKSSDYLHYKNKGSLTV